MPRRGAELVTLLETPKKKKINVEIPPSLDVSFCDDEALPPGIVFTDIQQKKWRIGKPIGRGSFGRIYLASDEVENDVTKSNARYVVKIEPHSNGPLFVEVHCLIRTAAVSHVKLWRLKNKMKYLGMPVYISSGSFIDENTGVKYRFLVLPRYDIDLQKIIARTKILDTKNVSVLALQILNVLEYLHDQGYTHSDIKSSNLMLGFDGGKWNKAITKPSPSFQKETKDFSVLSRKYRRVKRGKSRTSNYYDDEDFIIKDNRSSTETDNVNMNYVKVKNKIRKILSDRENRTLHRHHAFNLRQLSNYVNYEDINSSICSDQSYQKLLDDYGTKMHSEFDESCDIGEIHKEAVLAQSNGQIYLLDYGLASKFMDSEGKHKDFAMDARKAHDGTLEYSSRDSHIGAHSRRSDLETLGYNLLDWLTGILPWKTKEVLAEPDLVHAVKKNYMNDVKNLLKFCFKTDYYPQFLEKYLEYVKNLEYSEKPDYEYCKSLFKSELLKNGYDKETSLNFDDALKTSVNRKKVGYGPFVRKNTPPDFKARNGIMKAYERENVRSFEIDLKLQIMRQTLNSSSDGVRKPCASRNFFISDADLVSRLKKSLLPHDILGKKLSPKNLRSAKKNIQKNRGRKNLKSSMGKFGNFLGSAKQFTWAEILARNPEDIIRKERNAGSVSEDDDTCKYRIRKLSNASDLSDSRQSPLTQKDYLKNLNPTYAMKEVLGNFKKKMAGKPIKDVESSKGFEGFTPVMIKYYKLKEKNEAQEKIGALKETNKIEPICTRSMRKKVTEIPPPTRATRRTTTSVDSKKSKIAAVKVAKVKNTRTNKKITEEKVEIIDNPKPPTPKQKRSAKSKTEIAPNRRVLRSSKHKK